MTQQRSPTYVIHAPSYNENSGGTIFLHRLADELCRLGEIAAIWPKPPAGKPGLRLRARLKRIVRPPRFALMSGSLSRIAGRRDLHADTIAVYPTIVPGNPLGVSMVARWLMYPPSLRGTADSFGADELFFKASDFSDEVEVSGGAQLLHLFTVNPIYSERRGQSRAGTCYMVRKGTGKPALHNPETDICLDGLDHAAVTDEFNRCERFICYDEATFYSQYAAVCGCLSIVVPRFYSSRTAWVNDRPIAKFGVAHGLDDIDHAVSTRHLVLNHLHALEAEGIESVRRFVERTRAYFGFPARDWSA